MSPCRWYGHGWNRPLAWELILRLTPRLPHFVIVPLGHFMTVLCFACMPKERAAARRNLARVTGATGFANVKLAYRLFYNFSRFMVAYAEMRDLRVDEFRARLLGADSAERAMLELLAEGRGMVLATMHLGQWDLGLKLLSKLGVPVHVVMLNEDSREVARYADESRAWGQLRMHQMGSSPLLAVELMGALRRGEIVAIQLDRPVGDNVIRTPLFGAETDLPTGPVQLAMATGAPLLPAFILFDRGRNYRLLLLEALRFPRRREDGATLSLSDAMGRMTEVMETVVARYPDQWFNFYDVWPRESPRPERLLDAAP